MAHTRLGEETQASLHMVTRRERRGARAVYMIVGL